MKKIVVSFVMVLMLLSVLTISVFAAQESESNNSVDTATNISVNTSVSGNLSSSSDVDWYKFTVSEDGFFNITFQHELIDNSRTYWQIRLYDSTGVNFIDGNSSYFGVTGNSNKTTNTFGVKAGTYYVKINDDYYSDIAYSFKVNFTASSDWETENNNSKNDADEIIVNKTYNGSFSTDGDVDWYKLTIPQDGYFYVDFQHDLVDSTRTYWQIRLYDSTGVNFVDGNSSYFGVTGNSNKITNTFGVSAGTYYIKLNDDYYSGVNYNLCVKFFAASDWESENNNSKDSADLISVNQTYNGSFSTDGDVDWYKFNITENGYFVVDFQHELVDSTRTYWQMRLYDSTGINFIDGNSTYFGVTGNSNRTTNTFGVGPGTYFIKLNDDYYSGVNYTLNVKFVSADGWEKENNNSKDNANSMNVNSSINGALSTDGDTDWYKFTVSSQCEIAVVLNYSSLDSSRTYWVINLYDSSAVTKVLSFNCKANVTSSSSEYVSVPSGTYYIRITDDYYSGANYSLTVQEKHDCSGSFKTVKDPTCTDTGVQEKNCSICGKLLDTQTIPANGHNCDAWIIDKEATCSSEGKRHSTCEVCSEPVSENIPMIAHTLGDWNVTKEPTCHNDGAQTRTCSKCDYVENETLTALTHNFGEWAIVEETSC